MNTQPKEKHAKYILEVTAASKCGREVIIDWELRPRSKKNPGVMARGKYVVAKYVTWCTACEKLADFSEAENDMLGMVCCDASAAQIALWLTLRGHITLVTNDDWAATIEFAHADPRQNTKKPNFIPIAQVVSAALRSM